MKVTPIARDRRRRVEALRSDETGISFVEFALILPLFIGTMAAGLEMANLLLANMKVQRLATMTADLVAQRGASEKQISEMQIYDVLSALDLAADPLDVRKRGRVIVTAVLGEDSNADGAVDVNRIKWQRFDGNYVGASPILGCHTEVTSATLQYSRGLILNEAMFHAQVTYQYEPIFNIGAVEFFNVPTTITRTAAFRGRGSIFKPVLSVEGYPPKENCASANGL